MNFHIDQSVTRTAPGWWNWAVWLEGSIDELNKVREVVYTLHSTFPQPVRSVTDRQSKFRLEAAGWGEFMIFAAVKTIDNQEILLRHWLSFDAAGVAATTGIKTSEPVLFLSSSAADEPFADALQEALEGEGCRVVRPSDNIGASLPFTSWFDRMLETINGAVTIISDKTSPWLEHDLAKVGGRKLPIIPVVIGHAESNLPSELASREYLRTEGVQQEVASVAQRIQRIITARETEQHVLIMSTRERIVNYQEIYDTIQSYLAQVEQGKTLETEASTLIEISGGLQALEQAERNPDVMSGTADRAASLLQTFIAQNPMEPAAEEGHKVKFDNVKFDNYDILGWATSLFTWWKGLKKAPWRTAEASPTTVPNAFRIAVFGNWGTGMYGAPVCAASIARDEKGFQLVLHLGGTYYSGTEDEIRNRLLAVWPRVQGALNRTLNGNHEMYSGGHGYFGIALPHFGQVASYFAFQNDRWILACLDSAYSDYDLYGDQVDWLKNLVANGGDRRLILFTHHHPFSLLEGQGPKLVAKLSELLEAKVIFAWFWAHEHACILYDRHPAWGLLGRCVGHGGFPYFRNASFGDAPAMPRWVRLDSKNFVPGGQMLDGQNPYVKGHEREYGPHGYLVLEFDGPQLNEIIMNADGRILAERQLR